MLPKLFEIQNKTLVVNDHCLLIPELRAIVHKYQDPIPALSFLYYRFYPDSPYSNIPEDDKDDVIYNDYPGEYTLEDEEMLNAIQKVEKLCITPVYRYYLDNKLLLEKLGQFARTAKITAGRDGNLSALSSQIKSVGKTIMEFKQLEKVVIQELNELKGRARGGTGLAYDQ